MQRIINYFINTATIVKLSDIESIVARAFGCRYSGTDLPQRVVEHGIDLEILFEDSPEPCPTYNLVITLTGHVFNVNVSEDDMDTAYESVINLVTNMLEEDGITVG